MTTSASPDRFADRAAHVDNAHSPDGAGRQGGMFRLMLRQLGIDSGYVLTGFPLAVASFVVILTGLALGAGLAVIWVGVPTLALVLFGARGFAEVERVRFPPVLGIPRRRPTYRTPPPDASWLRRALGPITEGQYWLDAMHGLLVFPIALGTFVITFTWWALALGGLLYPLYGWAIPGNRSNNELPELLGFPDTLTVRIVAYLGIGAFALLTLPFVVRGCALVQAWFGRAMLNSVADLRQEIQGLTVEKRTAQAQTAAAVSAEATALRKLERDIHDGPQQRLVRLAVDLGRARHQFDSDPELARRTVDEAIAQTRETLDELRQLSRGIAPPILTDRGLGAAIAALAARSIITVDLDITGVGRLPAVTEQTAYFVVAEALTNVAKHSDGSACLVSLKVDRPWLRIRVSDNGSGGAHVSKGHGLAGLADRVHAAGGELQVTSPQGGPTDIYAEVPCPSPDQTTGP